MDQTGQLTSYDLNISCNFLCSSNFYFWHYFYMLYVDCQLYIFVPYALGLIIVFVTFFHIYGDKEHFMAGSLAGPSCSSCSCVDFVELWIIIRINPQVDTWWDLYDAFCCLLGWQLWFYVLLLLLWRLMLFSLQLSYFVVVCWTVLFILVDVCRGLRMQAQVSVYEVTISV